MKPLPLSFYQRPAKEVAKDLLGKIFVHRVGKKLLKARIVETEAYIGPHDLACHSAKGRTTRTEVMFGMGGHIYVYFIYGMYEMFNVVTGKENEAEAVLIRAAESLDDSKLKLSGPGKFTRGMKITRKVNGLLLTSDKIFFSQGPSPKKIISDKRIGVDYAGKWKDAKLRFYDSESSEISRHRKKIIKRGK
ncbi:MAG: DNA-3-methyladenine glycosylase [Deltaproteobacteria bacterium]|nr:DNA-3-methyladenine glycosylase [Deltaproteobacteria bacterium]